MPKIIKIGQFQGAIEKIKVACFYGPQCQE